MLHKRVAEPFAPHPGNDATQARQLRSTGPQQKVEREMAICRAKSSAPQHRPSCGTSGEDLQIGGCFLDFRAQQEAVLTSLPKCSSAHDILQQHKLKIKVVHSCFGDILKSGNYVKK